jgi:hypothetical protein
MFQQLVRFLSHSRPVASRHAFQAALNEFGQSALGFPALPVRGSDPLQHFDVFAIVDFRHGMPRAEGEEGRSLHQPILSDIGNGDQELNEFFP